MSVKSDSPRRPGGSAWRKITSCSGPYSARQARIRRSSVRRTPAPSAGCRRRSSSNTAIGLTLSRRAREVLLERSDDARSTVRDDDQRVPKPPPTHVLEEGPNRLGFLL